MSRNLISKLGIQRVKVGLERTLLPGIIDKILGCDLSTVELFHIASNAYIVRSWLVCSKVPRIYRNMPSCPTISVSNHSI